jgi:hypothetical protein
MNKEEVSNYTLVYSITALPNILFAATTKILEPLTFDKTKFIIPPEIKDIPIELRIYLFNDEGNLIEMTSNILPPSSSIICQTAELTGLKIVKKLLT